MSIASWLPFVLLQLKAQICLYLHYTIWLDMKW